MIDFPQRQSAVILPFPAERSASLRSHRQVSGYVPIPGTTAAAPRLDWRAAYHQDAIRAETDHRSDH